MSDGRNLLESLAGALRARISQFEEMLENMLPDTPSDCPCGRSANVHLEESIRALEALLSLDSGDVGPFWEDQAAHSMTEEDYAEYAIRPVLPRPLSYMAAPRLLAVVHQLRREAN